MKKCGSWVDAGAARSSSSPGAGISTDSGIPDFRGPQGVWTKNPKAEKLSNIRYYMADPEVRKARLAEPPRPHGLDREAERRATSRWRRWRSAASCTR